jgi:hypothetical protein
MSSQDVRADAALVPSFRPLSRVSSPFLGETRPGRTGNHPAGVRTAHPGAGLLAATTAGGAVLGAVAGHAAAGMSRHDLEELGEHLDAGQAGLVVVGVSDMGAKIEQAMRRAEKVQAKQLKADTAAIEADAKDAGAETSAAG